MKVKIYEYVGSYGGGIEYAPSEGEDRFKNDSDWEYKGEWDLPEDFIDKCLPAHYLE